MGCSRQVIERLELAEGYIDYVLAYLDELDASSQLRKALENIRIARAMLVRENKPVLGVSGDSNDKPA